MPRLEDLELQIKQTSASTNGIKNITDALGKLASSARATSTSAKAIKSLGDSMKSVSSSGVTSQIKATSEQMEKMSTGASEAAKGVESFKKTVKTTTRHTSGFGKSLLTTPWNAFKNKVTGVLKPLTNLYNSFKRIAMYRALRTALKEITQGFAIGVKNLYAWSGLVGNSFKGTMDSLATSMNYLRNSLGAMISPLLDALAPAVDILVDKFVDLVNLVNQFFATMTGKTTWRKALKTQKEYADNTDDAAKAQARLNHQLMAFDELNNISASSPSGGGGGGNNDDASADDFEEVPLPDWAKSIKDAIDRGDWAGAGSKLAEKLNNLVNNWDAEEFGNRLGAKFESALEFFNSFMEGTDWESIGTKLAGLVTGFLDKIDADQLGKAITQKFKAIVSTIKGFVWNVDLTKLATALGTAFNEIFSQDFMNDLGMTIAGMFNQVVTFVSTWVDTVNWEEDAKNLIGGLLTAIGNIDWGNTGETIGKLVAGIAAFIVSAIDEIVSHPETIISAIKDLVSGIFDGIWGEDGSGMLNIVKLTGWVAGIKLLFGGLQSTFSSAFGSALTGGAAEAFSATGSAATAVKGYMDTLAGKLGTVALIVGLTYIIATSGELNTPEKAAEKVEKENPFFNAFEEGDSDAFKVGFIDALKNDSEVKAAYEANLYQWGKDSAHQDQNAALAAARKVYEAKFNLEDSSNAGGGGHKFWWETVKDGLDDVSSSASTAAKKVKQLPPSDDDITRFKTQTEKEQGFLGLVEDSAATARKKVKQLPPDDDNVSKFKEQVAKERSALIGDKNSVKSAAKDAHDNGIAKMGPTTTDGNTFWTKVKNNFTTHLTGDSNSFVAKAGVAGTAGVNRLMPSKTDGNTFWSALNTNLTTHLTGDKNSFVAKADVAGTAGVKRLTPSKTDGNNFWTSLKNNFATHLTGDKNSISSAAGTASGKVAGIGTELGKVTGSQYDLDIDYADVTGVSNAAKTTYDYLSDAAGKTWTIKAKGDFEFKAVPSPDGKGWMYASGGFPSVGSMFVAGEAGPELVGTINGRNAVVSGGEISGISDAVYDTGEAETALLQQLLTVGRQLLAKSGQVTLAPNAAAGKWVAQAQTAYARATGG